MTDDFEPSEARRIERTQAAAAERRMLIIALLINSALYLTAAFIAGIALGNRLAWGSALIAVGLCYLAPLMQIMSPSDRALASSIVVLSIAFGALAGISLLFF